VREARWRAMSAGNLAFTVEVLAPLSPPAFRVTPPLGASLPASTE